MQKRFLEAGRIVNTHGTHGEVKIQPWADSADFLTDFENIYIDGAPLRVINARVHKGFVIAILEGVEDINSAMRLKNKVISIERSSAKLPDGSFFIQDVFGVEVYDSEGLKLGKVSDVLFMPSHNIYVVTGEREYLIPAVPEFVTDLDIPGGRMTVKLIDGM